MYTPRETSKLLGVSVKTIRRWDKQGKIKCVRTIGGKRRVPESEIKRILGIHEERKIVGMLRYDKLSRDKSTFKSFTGLYR